ncbi:chemotaxis protein CheA [Escherichia coli H413]|nr:chemotaxis protein CheA [Escherichia coli H413]
MSMDISDFYQTFFDEADELLADMEQHLLVLQPEAPDAEQLNAIFRAAHSIKGGAGTFGFSVLQETTHLMENLLDEARRGEMQLNTDIINLFWKRRTSCKNSSTLINSRKSRMPPASIISARPYVNWH